MLLKRNKRAVSGAQEIPFGAPANRAARRGAVKIANGAPVSC
jgi:hypothetical protein